MMTLRKTFLCVASVAMVIVNSWSSSVRAQDESIPAIPLLPAVRAVPIQQAVPATEADQAQDPMQQYLRQQQAAREALEPLRKNAPYQEVEPISLPNGRQILGFTALRHNELAVISGKASEYGAVNALIQAFTKQTPNELIWLDAQGQVIRIAPLSFLPAAVNVAPDGMVFVVGDGKIAQFSADGKLVADVESPHAAAVVTDRARLENDIRARREQELKSLRENVTATEEATKVLQEKPESQRTEEEKSELEMYKQSAASLKVYVEQQEKQPLQAYIEAALTEIRQVHRVAASDKELFIVTRQMGGYGFAVWRMNRDFTDAKQIIDGLAGCCGQMDVQVHNDTLFVAENARHRVGQYDRDGNQVTSFGSATRDDVLKGFGSCCNPMNTCFTSDGDVLTSESNGVVKRFKTDGELAEVAGIAKVEEGCKNSSIGISSDGSRLYYFDVQQGRLLVLKRT